MTNTIPNVPRELKPVLAMILNALDRDAADGKQARAEMAAELRTLLSAPSPACVDGLKRYEVFPYLDDEVAEMDICESDDGTFVKYDDAQAIIDGLRGEVEDLIEARDSRVSARIAILDQQAQRIGELEGLLRNAFPRIDITKPVPLDEKAHCCEYTIYVERERLHKLIDAALSAGKEDAQ